MEYNENMKELLLHIPSNLYYGIRSRHNLRSVIDKSNKRTIIITEGILRKEGILKELLEVISPGTVEPLIFEEVEVNSTSTAAEKAIKLIRAGKIDTVIGFGGVRALSIAKCSAAAAPHKEGLDAFLSGKSLESIHPGERLIYMEIPTTCRNPFLLNGTALLIDGRDRSPAVLETGSVPDTVIIDPAFSVSLTAGYTFTTLLDTILLALEGFLSGKSTFLSNTMFLQGAMTACSLLEEKEWQNIHSLEARERASRAGTFVGIGLSGMFPGMGSLLSHIISGSFMVPQSSVAAVLLPHIIEWAEKSVPEKTRKFTLEVYRTSGSRERSFSDQIRSYISDASLPLRLIDLDIKPKNISKISEFLLSLNCLRDMPLAISKEEINQLLTRAL